MMHYLADDIKYVIINAILGTVILLAAPTGAGKTTFFLTEYLREMRMHGRKILYVVNRTTLRRQILRKLSEFFGIEADDIAALMEKGYVAFDGITVVTYQYLEKKLTPPDNRPPKAPKEEEDQPVESWPMPLNLDDVNVVVFDEAHFFLSDGMFNPGIDAFEKVPREFSKAIRIYVSATLAPVRDTILKMEGIVDMGEPNPNNCFSPRVRYVQDLNSVLAKLIYPSERQCLELIGAEADYSYLIPSVIKDDKDGSALEKSIMNKIESGELKKALVFVSSKEQGKSLKNKLEQKNISTCFIFADSSTMKMDKADREAEQTVISNGKVDACIILATAKLDNGVTLEDPEITHVYPYGFEEIELIQQVGRVRRVSESYYLNMILRVPSKETIVRLTNKYSGEIKILEKYERAHDKEREKMLYDGNNLEIIRRYSIPTQYGKRKVSESSKSALKYYLNVFKRLKNTVESDPEDGIAKEWFGYFGLKYPPEHDEREQARQDAKSKFIAFLEGSLEQEMDNDTYDHFREQFRDLYPGSEILCNGRKDRKPGFAAMNGILAEAEYGMELKRPGTGKHILKRKKED